jgi:uncharacterized protein YrrD
VTSMRFREAQGRKVVSTDDAETVGRVDRYVVDPSTRRVTALHLAKVKGDRCLVPWSDVQAFGPDAVTVTTAASLREADQAERRAASKDLQMLGKRVLVQSGDSLGTVGDVEFDPETGAIVALELEDGTRVDGGLLIGVGSYAVVVAGSPA